MEERRLKILRIVPELLIQIAKTNKEPFRVKTTCEGLPADAALLGCAISPDGDIDLIVYSKEFTLLASEEPIPFADVRYFQAPIEGLENEGNGES